MKTQTAIRSLAIAGAMLLIVFAYSFTLQKEDTPLDYIKANIADEYPSVIIGTQEWMTENLNVDKFRNGDPIPEAQSKSEWKIAGENGQPAWCYYDNDPANEKIYGKLYNWYAVNDPRGLAPEGWHVPSDEEWTILTEYLGGSELALGKMKSTGTQYWNSPNEEATNSSGFSGLPGGARATNGVFDGIGLNGNWWSSSEKGTNSVWGRTLNFDIGPVVMSYGPKGFGLSVRCLRD